jgi:glutamate-1-semialdehyde 2,1-aminomutase
MLARGIHLPPSPFEAWFWSAAHGADEIRTTLEVAEEVLTITGAVHA